MEQLGKVLHEIKLQKGAEPGRKLEILFCNCSRKDMEVSEVNRRKELRRGKVFFFFTSERGRRQN